MRHLARTASPSPSSWSGSGSRCGFELSQLGHGANAVRHIAHDQNAVLVPEALPTPDVSSSGLDDTNPSSLRNSPSWNMYQSLSHSASPPAFQFPSAQSVSEPWSSLSPIDLLAMLASPGSPVTVDVSSSDGPIPSASTASSDAFLASNPLHKLYPDVPAEILPPLAICEILIDNHKRYNGVIHHVVHYPTFCKEVQSGKADVGVLSTMLWGSLRTLDPTGPEVGGWTWDMVRSEKVRKGFEAFCVAWVLKEVDECRPKTGGDDDTLLRRLENLGKSLIFALCITLASGMVELHERFHKELLDLFPRLKFGQLPGDLVNRPASLAGWLRSECRARLCWYSLVTDIIISDSLEKERAIIPRGGLQDLDPLTGTSATLRGANMPVPCPDQEFDLEDPRETSTEHPEPISIGLCLFWPNLPRNSPARQHYLSSGAGLLLCRGYTVSLTIKASMWCFVADYVDLCTERGYLVCFPPEKDQEAVQAREKAVTALEDVWDAMPPEIVQLDGLADGAKLRQITGAAWASFREDKVVQILAYLHGFQLVLNSPYDLVNTWRYAPGDEPEDPNLETWPFSDRFVQAEAHAISISRLIRSGMARLKEDGGDEASLSFDARTFPPIWAVLIARACWVHAIAIRKLRYVLRSAPLPLPSVQEALDALKALFGDIAGALVGMAELEDVWNHNKGAMEVIRGLVDRDDADEAVWMRLTVEETATLYKKAARIDRLSLLTGK